MRRFQTPEIDAATSFSQTFIMTADGFHAIEFAAAPAGGPVSGNLRLELQEEGSGVVRSAEVSAADVISAPSYRFEFQPIPDSKDSVYRLDVLSSEKSSSKGVAVWATKGERYRGGTMLVNDRPRWADLAFETFAPSGRSSWRRLMDMPGAESGHFSRAQVVIAGLAAYWAALGIVLSALKSRLTNEGVVLAGLLALFICRAVVANAIVPPWQGPDEPGHFALAYGLTMPADMQQRIQVGVLQSMVRHRWWDLYDDPPPNPLTPDRVYGLGWGTLAQPVYYGLGAAALRVSHPADLETAYYHLRFLSVLLAAAALTLGWAGVRLLFGPEIALGAAAIGALHPQFLLVALTVNPDALLNVWGAFVWWQAARVVTGYHRALSVVLMLVGAVGALFTKRIGIVLVGVAVVVAVASLFASRTWRVTRRDALLMAMIGIVCAAVLLAAGFLFERLFSTWWVYWSNALTIRRPLEDATLSEAYRSVRMTVDYFWLIAGWLRFQPPESWLWIARVLTLGGIAGAAVVLIESRTERPRLSVPWLFMMAQVVVMLVVVTWTNPSAPQARYIFPVFTPIAVLLYVGLRRAVPATFHRHWPAVLVVILAMLDVTGFTTVHIPTYIP